VKRSARDETVGVVILMCMEAMLGIALKSLSQTSKNTMSFLLLLMSSLQQNWRRGQNRFCLEARELGGEVVGSGEKWPKQCMHM
jgi:hypothetical protein